MRLKNNALFRAFGFFLAALAAFSAPAARADTVLTPAIAVGSTPVGVAINGHYAYVANSATVSVIDTTTNTVVSTITVGGTPRFVMVTPDGNYVYVASVDGTVSVIDTTLALTTPASAVIATIPTSNPTPTYFMAATPDGQYVYVANRINGIRVIATPSNTNTAIRNTVVSTLALGGAIMGVAITQDGQYAYAVGTADNVVRVIDTALALTDPANAVTDRITAGATSNYSVVLTPDGQYAYVTNYGDNTVSVIAIATNTVVATIPTGASPFAVAFSGQYAYVTNQGDGTVTVIDTALALTDPTLAVVDTIAVGSAPDGVAITPDGQFAYVANSGDGTVTVIALASLSSLPDHGNVNAAYSGTVTVSDAAAGVSTFSITAGSLPPGLTLDPATGQITGTPTATGTYAFTVSADSAVRGLTQTGVTRDYTIVVDAALPAAAAAVPTLGDVALVALALLLGMSAVAVHRRGL